MLTTLLDEPAFVTFRSTFAECVSDPLVPVIVKVAPPRGVPVVVVIVSVELPDIVTEVGENVDEAPLGEPAVTAKLTTPVNPFSAATFTV